MKADKQTAKTEGRNANGTFAKGNAGGPGRPVGAVNALLRQVREAAQEVVPMMLDKARGGDMFAMRTLLELGLPKTKPMPERMNPLPDFPFEAEPRHQQAYLLGCMAAGLLTVDEVTAYRDIIAGTHKLPTQDTESILFGANELPENLKAALRAILSARGHDLE